MKTNQEYKNAALAALKGNWAPSVVCMIIVSVIGCVVMVPYMIEFFRFMSVSEAAVQDPGAILQASKTLLAYIGVSVILGIFIAYPLYVGICNIFNSLLVKGEENLIFGMFKMSYGRYFHNLAGILLMYLFIGLWSMLFCIPGIIKSFSYSMTPYILADYPELSANQAINLSCKMMKGHKFDLFWLCLSFLGWILLASFFTLGIGFLWLGPYMQTSVAAFYQDVKSEYESRETLKTE